MCAPSWRSFAAVLALASSLSCWAIDPASLPPFDASRVYQVPGATMEALRLGLIDLDAKLKNSETQLSQAAKISQAQEVTLQGLQTSYSQYKTRTTIALILLGGVAIVSTSLLVTCQSHTN